MNKYNFYKLSFFVLALSSGIYVDTQHRFTIKLKQNEKQNINNQKKKKQIDFNKIKYNIIRTRIK